MAVHAFTGQLRPISSTANQRISRRVVEDIRIRTFHPANAWCDEWIRFAESQIFLVLQAASARGRWQ
jgi:hypothetical protein